MTTYERGSNSGGWAKTRFCNVCGSTVLFDVEAQPGAIGVAGGSFDDTNWNDPELHAWARSAQKWYRFPNDANVLQESAVGVSHGRIRKN